MTTPQRHILDEQIAYYRARASEYDEWFLRTGRYDRGAEHTAAWFGEAAEVERALRASGPRGRCLELACGTGLWTRHLARLCDTVTAVDVSPEVLRINHERVASPRVRYIEADLFAWEPEETYDFVFFSFWLSHVPEEGFEPFWSFVARALAPEGRVFFLDSLLTSESTARDHAPPGTGGVVERKLNDGRTFRVVKIFYDPADLQVRLEALGWRARVRSSGRFFLHGTADRDRAGDEPG